MSQDSTMRALRTARSTIALMAKDNDSLRQKYDAALAKLDRYIAKEKAKAKEEKDS